MGSLHPGVDDGIPACASVREGDAEYTPELRRIGRDIDVALDGKVLTRVIAYDAPAGTVLRFATDDANSVKWNEARRDLLTERLAGKVEVRWKPGRTPC